MNALLAQALSLFDPARDCTGGPLRLQVAGEPLCTFEDLVAFLYRLLHFAITTLAPAAVTIAVIWGAFLIMLAGANPAYLTRGKNIIFDAVVGLLIVWGAWIIVNTVFMLLDIKLPCGAAWYQLTCPYQESP
jgi:hypothetical protein